MNTAEAAHGKWRNILPALGVPAQILSGKHCPCPMCGGRDRFRFDDKGGKGGYICSQCGAGDGFKLLCQMHGWSFREAALAVDEIVGSVEKSRPKREMTEPQRREMLTTLWNAGTPLDGEDMASQYLAGRNVMPSLTPSHLRFVDRCPVPGGGTLPAMIARVQDSVGMPCSIHRTFLGPNGKADLANPRAFMPGEIPNGSAVRLIPVHGARLGIAEGIETALAASKRFNLPVWAALNSTLLAKWIPPTGVEEIVVFGDCDPAFGGQKAAFELAHRLVIKHRVKVDVRIPSQIGKDWADVGAA